MPRNDKTGPRGQGKMTGRGMGQCNEETHDTSQCDEHTQTTSQGRVQGQGMGHGRRQVHGMGQGRKQAHGMGGGRKHGQAKNQDCGQVNRRQARFNDSCRGSMRGHGFVEESDLEILNSQKQILEAKLDIVNTQLENL